jgi:hypothetical protein
MKKYRVTLTEDERAALGQRVSSGRGPARELTRARILLKADQGPHGPGWRDLAIAAALDVGVSTIERVRKRCAASGLEVALRHRRPRREYRRKLDGEQEAHLIALACSPPPVGRRLWTLRLLADRMIELRFVDGLSPRPPRSAVPAGSADPSLRPPGVVRPAPAARRPDGTRWPHRTHPRSGPSPACWRADSAPAPPARTPACSLVAPALPLVREESS